jgi:lipase chaperone LimK
MGAKPEQYGKMKESIMKSAGKIKYFVFAPVGIFIFIGFLYWMRADNPQPIPSNTVSAVIPAGKDTSRPAHSKKDEASARANRLSHAGLSILMSERVSPPQHDTEIDGRLREDRYGNLIVDASFKDLFDYFFSALGEKTPEQIAVNMELYIDSALSPGAAEQARALLRNFMAYNRDLAQHAAAGDADMSELNGSALLDDLKAYHAYLKNARNRHFGELYSELFFGSEEKYQEYNIARLELSFADLPEEEKKRQIEDLRSQLPEMQQEIIRDHERLGEFMKREHAWQNENVSDQELYNRRLTSYGYDAAERMKALDQKNLQWQDRLKEFFTEVDRINATDWPETEKRGFIEGIKVSDFSKTERLRLDVIARFRQQRTTARN